MMSGQEGVEVIRFQCDRFLIRVRRFHQSPLLKPIAFVPPPAEFVAVVIRELPFVQELR